MQGRSGPFVGVVAACVCFLAAACDTPLESSSENVERIVLSPSSASVQAGATVTIQALVLDAEGNALRERKVVWASENETIATVSQSGVVTGVTAGVAQIAASSGGKSASAMITVTARPVSLVRITPGSATIAVSGSITLQVEAVDASGAPVVGRPVLWTSSDESVAIVSASGIVAGLSVGTVRITATIDGRTGTAEITVAPQPVASVVITPGADTIIVSRRATFRATALDAQNQPLANRIVVWASSDPVVATVTSDGEAIGHAVGSARIRATVEGKFAEATLVVQPVPVARVIVAPNQVTLNPGQTSQLTVTASDSAGNVLSGRSVTYVSSDAQIATVSSTGLITAVAEGAAQIQVESEGVTATMAVTVNPAPVASITLAPNGLSLLVAQSARIVAQAFDAQGKLLSNRSFLWSSNAPSVATVDQSGLVTAVGQGGASISASSEGKTAIAAVSVASVPVSVASMAISPKPLSLSASQQQQLVVQFYDSAGGALGNVSYALTWVSRDPAIATVNGSGQVSAVATGQTRVVATASAPTGMLTDSVDITVAAAPITSLALQTQVTTIHPGQSTALRAMVSDAGGIVRGRNVSWVTSAPSIVTVTPVAGWPDSATAVGVALGSAYVVASDPSGLRDSTLVSVTPVPVASVVVSPATASLTVNTTTQLTASATDAGGNPVSPSITWVSQQATIATVSGTGIVTAVDTGSTTIEARATAAGVGGTDVIGTATVTVSPPAQAPVNSVTLTSPRGFVVPGDTMHLTVVLRDAQGNILTGRTITYASSQPGRVGVDASGVVTGVGTGNATITATSEGKTGQVSVSGMRGIATMSVSGPKGDATDLIIAQKGTKKYTVTIRDGAGSPISGYLIGVSVSSGVVTITRPNLTTNSAGEATVELKAGNTPGVVIATFSAPARSGAIPPGAPGTNNVAPISLPIVVP